LAPSFFSMFSCELICAHCLSMICPVNVSLLCWAKAEQRFLLESGDLGGVL
jgi:hypothetical protein